MHDMTNVSIIVRVFVLVSFNVMANRYIVMCAIAVIVAMANLLLFVGAFLSDTNMILMSAFVIVGVLLRNRIAFLCF